ncbi:nitrous oxide reductase accessory protein NosL [Lysinibacillus parviboronicapiens]|uniref:nitrous oxide reductase accessory protein NosL n=1 Tax=Lysinibacillus parviboronicapiens TaxID=436516 RepID=UPI0006CFCE44|nr:nitrous oxide reductase accessory protein NosL [Lysinibacillus parviboronicapiens]
MKRWIVMVVISCVLLVGCGDKTYVPREIVGETDVCKICNMSIVHNEYAGQIALKNGDFEMFDDLGCLMEYIKANGENEIGAAFIKDANNDEWIDVFKATFIYNKEYWTPMNYGVLAFKTKDAAVDWMALKGEGQVLVYQDLQNFNWGIHQ